MADQEDEDPEQNAFITQRVNYDLNAYTQFEGPVHGYEDFVQSQDAYSNHEEPSEQPEFLVGP